MSRTINGVVQIKDDTGQTVHRLDAETGRALIGATGQDGLLFMNNRDGRSTVSLHGNRGRVNLGGNGQDGELVVENSEGNKTIRLEGRHATADLGGNGKEGSLLLRDAEGKTALSLLSKRRANDTSLRSSLKIGGARSGELIVENSRGTRVIELDGFNRRVTLGNDVIIGGIDRGNGDIFVKDSENFDTVRIDGKDGIVVAEFFFEVSDERRKDDITPLSKTLDKVLAIQGVSYTRKPKNSLTEPFNDGREIGLIAQEVEAIFPEVVFTDTGGNKSLSYSRLIPVLVEAIKEQQILIQEQASALNEVVSKLTH
ncbi:MAG: hypothetical protein NPIRA04_23630 [Nitrospirales bacterium]|nr:MAG: hypothetical protein NPIRA04_23630 [Nitrospirales bacterium]